MKIGYDTKKVQRGLYCCIFAFFYCHRYIHDHINAGCTADFCSAYICECIGVKGFFFPPWRGACSASHAKAVPSICVGFPNAGLSPVPKRRGWHEPVSWWVADISPVISGSELWDLNMRVALLASIIAVILAASVCYSSRVSSSVLLPFTDCVRSRGKDGFYRGSIDVTESGSRCMNWTEVAGFEERHPGKGIGEHNHCRNPDSRLRPWCFFRNHKGRVDWGYCDCKQGKHTGPHGIA